MREALALLRRSKLGGRWGRQHLYQLPWYIIIGPPGAGKTTAIVNSGLRFPLAEKLGMKAIGGIGGTRNCDWWFTNEAVLIDTAGRYTTQDSDAGADAKAWSGFLDILKRYRTRQPINGALVAISLSDLSLLDEPSRRAHAGAIRKRLGELRARLGVRFPVYVLFTKADLIAGFQEYFEALGKDGREQVWGFTLSLPAKGDETPPLARFDEEFDGLLGQLNNLSLERMQQETDAQRRALIQGFPQQLASLREVGRDFLTEIFQDSRFEDRQLLRGVYFTSGTQEGTPIDRLMMGMARAFGIGRQAIGSGQGQGRSYFLTRLLQGVIFREAGIVSADDRVERRYRWIVRGGVTVSTLLVLGFAAVWTLSFLGNRALVASAREQVVAYQSKINEIKVDPVADTDLVKVVEALNLLRDMPGNPAQDDPEPPTELTWGLYQGDAIGNDAAQTYRSALNQLLLPRLLLRLEGQLASNIGNPDVLYEGLKVYLMLGLQGPMDQDLVRLWLAADWSENAYPGQQNAQLRADLAGHLDRLLGQTMQEIALHGHLVERVREVLAETPIARRIFNGIVGSPDAAALPEWRVANSGGPDTSRVLVRPSGELLSKGVAGIYTYRGFHTVFLPAALDVARQVTRESWVLGPRGEDLTTEEGLATVARDVLNTYYTAYRDQWVRILGDLDVVPIRSMAEAVTVTNILSGANSPIRNVLTSVAEETKLAVVREAIDIDKASKGALELGIDEATTGLSARTQALVNLLKKATPGATPGSEPEPDKPGQWVQDQFSFLHEYVAAPEGQTSQLDLTIATLLEVYQELNRLSIGGGTPLGTAPLQGGAPDKLREATTNLPNPAKRWATQVANSSSEVVTGGERARLNTEWQSKVLPFCERTLDGRYPFKRNAATEVAIQDFARLFAQNGLIDSFFSQYLAAHVDARAIPWKWRRVEGKDLGISDAVLRQFQLASDIRNAFFLAPGLPQVTFEITPFGLGDGVQKWVLELDGQPVEYAGGPPETTPMQWPGKAGGRNRIAFVPPITGSQNEMSQSGPWAMFRLLDAADVKPSRQVADQVRVYFSVGGRTAIFDIRAGSAFNAFALPALASFSCPRSL
jgi:type VI secretion system protein ImpL